MSSPDTTTPTAKTAIAITPSPTPVKARLAAGGVAEAAGNTVAPAVVGVVAAVKTAVVTVGDTAVEVEVVEAGVADAGAVGVKVVEHETVALKVTPTTTVSP